MNKKMLTTTLTATLLSLSGCSAQEQPKEPRPAESGKILVAYYSWGGNTRFAADRIIKVTGAERLEIKPVTPYPTIYKECTDQAKKEVQTGFKPELEPHIDLTKYEVIFVGTPNWWSTIAPPVRTFLTQDKLAGKTIIPFITHGGGGMANCETDMKKLAARSTFIPGAAFSGNSIRQSDDAITKWVNSIVKVTKNTPSTGEQQKMTPQNPDIFPKGQPVTVNFTGEAWLATLIDNPKNDISVYNVTFTPGCRNDWHTHALGQILICTSGTGYYQERGKPARHLTPGSILDIPPNIEHWHGASTNTPFTHIGITPRKSKNSAVWTGPVSDKEYQSATTQETY